MEHFRRTSARPLVPLPDERMMASSAPDPLEDLLRMERAEIVRSVLRELASERDRQILFRFYIAEAFLFGFFVVGEVTFKPHYLAVAFES